MAEKISEAKERVLKLLDAKSFVEVNEKSDLGVICGYGTIKDRPVCVFSQNGDVFSGAFSVENCEKICNIIDVALKTGVPIIGFYDSIGAKLQEDIKVLKSINKLIKKIANASGVIPQIAVISGSAVGIAGFMATLSDFIFMIKSKSKMFINGPQVVTSITGKEVTAEEIGGSDFHFGKTGTCHIIVDSEDDVISKVKNVIAFLPDNNLSDIEIIEADDRNRDIQTSDIRDIRPLISEICDDSIFCELQSNFAENIIIGFGRIGGRGCGIVANNEYINNGKLDIDGMDKAYKFVKFCDAFNMPIITLINSDGFEVSLKEEEAGLAKKGAKVIFAYADATVPKIDVIVGKSFGGSSLMLGAGADITLAWDSAKIALLDPKTAANILYSEEIAAEEDPVSFREIKAKEYLDNFATAEHAEIEGFIDSVINYRDTRKRIISSLDLFLSKREIKPVRKHGTL